MTALREPTALDAATAREITDRIKVGVEAVWTLVVDAYRGRAWLALGYTSWDDYTTREFGTARLRLPREERAETVQSLRDAGLSLRAIASATGHSQHTIIRDLREREVLQSAAPEIEVQETAESVEELDRRLGPIGYEHANFYEDDEPVEDAIAAFADGDQGVTSEPDVDRETGEVLDELEPQSEPARTTGIDGKTYQRLQVRRPPRKALVEVAKTRGFTLRQSVDSLLKLFEDDRYRSNEKQVADVLRGHLLYVAETVAAVLDQLS